MCIRKIDSNKVSPFFIEESCVTVNISFPQESNQTNNHLEESSSMSFNKVVVVASNFFSNLSRIGYYSAALTYLIPNTAFSVCTPSVEIISKHSMPLLLSASCIAGGIVAESIGSILRECVDEE